MAYMNSEYTNANINLSTKYKIERIPIGKGSFATVYKATNKNNETVAIKQIKIANLRQDRIDKFMLELDISREINHENIVKCQEIFKTKNHWYIVLEYCNGPSFTQTINFLKNIESFKREEIVKKYMIQLKNALQYLRSKNIIHRDLKPDNILLQSDIPINLNIPPFGNLDEYIQIINTLENCTLKLADFGFARYLDKEQELQDGNVNLDMTICGTPLYMAPEILINNKYNIKADLWAFGVIMYQALYGYNPFIAPNMDIKLLSKMIQNTNLAYSNNISNDANDLIKKLVVPYAPKRIDWDTFFNHKWFDVDLENELKIKIDDNTYDTSIDNLCENRIINTKPINIPNKKNTHKFYSYSQPEEISLNKKYNLSPTFNIVPNNTPDDDDDDFIFLTNDDKLDFADIILDRDVKLSNIYKTYESISGSFIRILSSPKRIWENIAK